MKRKKLCAVIFGPQGSGKGTQGDLLSARYDIPLIGAGDLFRSEIQEKSTLGKLVSSYVGQGLLAPDELVNALMARQLKKSDLTRGFMLDGYPRNIEQAGQLDKLIKINLAIQLKMSDKEVIKRLSGRVQCPACKSVYHDKYAPPAVDGICSICGHALERREDDKEDVIKERLKGYHFMTEPLAVYYRSRGVLLAVNAEQPIPYLFDELVSKLCKLGFICH